MDEGKILDISWGTIFKVLIGIVLFYFLFLIKNILILFIFALIISVLFNPAINFLAKRKIPRALSVVIIYLFIFGIVGFLIYLIAPIFISEINNFSGSFQDYFNELAPLLKGVGGSTFESFSSFTGSIQGWLTMASSSILSAVGAIFGGIFSTLTIFSIAIFLSMEEKGIEKTLLLIFPKKYEPAILNFWRRSSASISGWFGTRVIACIFVGVMFFVAAEILSVKYAVVFAFLAGVLNIVPIVGPVVAALVIVLITLLDNWIKALFILIAYVLIQQIEGNILTPLITKRFIGMPPVLVLLAVLVGGTLWGVLGAFLAIPLFGIIFEFLKNFLKKRRDEEAQIT